MMKSIVTSLLLLLLANPACAALDAKEKEIAKLVEQHQADQVALIEQTVNINSSTYNIAGVKQVGNVFADRFKKIGFDTQWIEVPANMERAGHLFATHAGKQGKKILLVAHLDTVFEKDNPFQKFERDGDIATGPGVVDDKGGIAVIFTALQALHEAKVLDDAHVMVAMVGDEEAPAKPYLTDRKSLIDVAKNSDVALAFESGQGLNSAVTSRRGNSVWELTTTGKPGHSSLIFSEKLGYGAIYEMARALTQVQGIAENEQYITMNPGMVLGGGTAEVTTEPLEGKATGRGNVIAEIAKARGDCRYLYKENLAALPEKINAKLKDSLPGTTAAIKYDQGQTLPSMPPNQGNADLLAQLSQVNQDLGLGAIKANDPMERGAADAAFIAEYLPVVDGLGAVGGGDHSDKEYMVIPETTKATQRLAIALYRMINAS